MLYWKMIKNHIEPNKSSNFISSRCKFQLTNVYSNLLFLRIHSTLEILNQSRTVWISSQWFKLTVDSFLTSKVMKYMIFCLRIFNVNVVNYKLSQTFEKNILLKSFICSTKKFMQELRKYKLINYKKQKIKQ